MNQSKNITNFLWIFPLGGKTHSGWGKNEPQWQIAFVVNELNNAGHFPCDSRPSGLQELLRATDDKRFISCLLVFLLVCARVMCVCLVLCLVFPVNCFVGIVNLYRHVCICCFAFLQSVSYFLAVWCVWHQTWQENDYTTPIPIKWWNKWVPVHGQ